MEFSFEETEEKQPPIEVAYNNLKSWKSDKQADLFPVILDYQKAEEENIDRFFNQYAKDHDLDSSELTKPVKVFKMIKAQQPNGLEIIAERYKKEAIAQIYENLHRLRKGQKIQENDLLQNKTIKILESLQNEKDIDQIFTVLEKYQIMKQESSKKDAATMALKTFLSKDLVRYNSIINNLEELSEHFDKDVIADLINRNNLEKQQAELEPRGLQLDRDIMYYGKAFDDIKVIMFQQGYQVKEYEKVSPEDLRIIKEANIGYKEIEETLLMELSKIQQKSYEYRNKTPEMIKDMEMEVKMILEEIQEAKGQDIKPVDFFNEDHLSFLYWLFEERFNQALTDKNRLDDVSVRLFEYY